MQDVVTHNGHPYFISVLQQSANGSDAEGVSLKTQAQAVFVLTMVCDGYPLGQQRCLESGLLNLLIKHLDEQNTAIRNHISSHGHMHASRTLADNLLLLKWCLLAMGKLFNEQPSIVHMAQEPVDTVQLIKVRWHATESINTAVLCSEALFNIPCWRAT